LKFQVLKIASKMQKKASNKSTYPFKMLS